MSDAESRPSDPAITNDKLRKCRFQLTGSLSTPVMPLCGPLSYCLPQASTSIFFFFFSKTRIEYASVENHQTIPPSQALPKSRGKIPATYVHNRRTLIRRLTPTASRTGVYRETLPRGGNWTLPSLVCHNFCESPRPFFLTTGGLSMLSKPPRCPVPCRFFQFENRGSRYQFFLSLYLQHIRVKSPQTLFNDFMCDQLAKSGWSSIYLSCYVVEVACCDVTLIGFWPVVTRYGRNDSTLCLEREKAGVRIEIIWRDGVAEWNSWLLEYIQENSSISAAWILEGLFWVIWWWWIDIAVCWNNKGEGLDLVVAS